MNELAIILGWVGIYGVMALGAIGSIIGCATAGQAAIGAMMDIEGGYGKFVGVSAMPSTQIIFGIVVMFSLNQPVTAANGGALFAIGILAGTRVDAVRHLARPRRRLVHRRLQGQARDLWLIARPGGNRRGLRRLHLRLRAGARG